MAVSTLGAQGVIHSCKRGRRYLFCWGGLMGKPGSSTCPSWSYPNILAAGTSSCPSLCCLYMSDGRGRSYQMEEAEHARWRWQSVSEGEGLARQVEEESVYQVQGYLQAPEYSFTQLRMPLMHHQIPMDKWCEQGLSSPVLDKGTSTCPRPPPTLCISGPSHVSA